MTISSRLIAVLICLSTLAACGRSSPEEVQTAAVVPVTVETVVTGDVRSAAHVTGFVEPAPGADLMVTAPAPARIVEIPKAEGDTVRRGDLLVRFEIPSLAADTASKRAEIDRATARLLNARSAQARAKDLFDRGVGARKELEDAVRELADAEAALTEAKANLAASTTLESRAVVRATFDGLVAKRSHNPGDLVEPGSGDPVLRVLDPRRLEVAAAVQFADVPFVRPGAVAQIRVGSGDPQPAKVVSLAAAVDPATGAAPVRLRFDRPTRVAAGTPVQVEIETQVHKGVLVVPAAAIIREGDEAVVFVANGDKAERRVVEVGLTDGEHVEVVKGVKAGEAVITKGMNGLPDDAKISTEPPGKGEKDTDKAGEADKDAGNDKDKAGKAGNDKDKAAGAGKK
jgi:RND family efflux transporter MFP subunit